jgi:hypothetical protein
MFLVFDFENDTFEMLKYKINQLGQSFSTVGIFQHNYNSSAYQFIYGMKASLLDIEKNDSGLESWEEFYNFLIFLMQEKDTRTLDFISCNIWNNPDWRYIIENIEDNSLLEIRASSGIIGKDGSWFMDKGSVDLTQIYFNKDILTWQGQLIGNTISSNTTITSLASYNWPVTIAAGSYVTIGASLTLTASSQYFIVGGSGVTIDGSQNTLTFSNITGYPGLVQNGQYNVSGYSNLTIQNMNLSNSGSSLVYTNINGLNTSTCGWIGQNYFCKDVSSSYVASGIKGNISPLLPFVTYVSTIAPLSGWIGQRYFGNGGSVGVNNTTINNCTSVTDKPFLNYFDSSLNVVDMSSYFFPVTLSGGSVGNQLTTKLTSSFTISNPYQYFIIASPYITIDGSSTTLSVTGVTNYKGLIQNGTSSQSGYSNFTIQNLTLTNAGSTILAGQGWIGQKYYGNSVTSSSNMYNVQSEIPYFAPITTNTVLGALSNYSWPITISGGSIGNPVKVQLSTPLTITTIYQYFTIYGQNVTIDGSYNGSTSGITISSVTNYPGLVQNGNITLPGQANLTLNNLSVTVSSSTQPPVSGWIGQRYFGNGGSVGIITPTINNCTSSTGTAFLNYFSSSVNIVDLSSYCFPITLSGGTVGNPTICKFSGTSLLSPGFNFTNPYQYFIAGSPYVTIDGSYNNITFSGITNYPGLVKNGAQFVTGYSNLTVRNMSLINNNTILAATSGGVGQNGVSYGVASSA